MALNVPYRPVPDINPQAPGESISVATPGAAFGTNIASALQHLGQTTEHVGDELFSRANALQDITNQADARNAQTEYATKSAMMQADFDAKTGKDSYTSLQDHLKALADLRTQIRGGLKTQMAQQHFDSDSLPFMQRMIFTSAGRAAGQQKEYVLNSYGAQSDVINRQAEEDPNDDVAFARNGEKLRQATQQAAMIKFGTHDPNDPIVKNAVEKAMQKFLSQKIKGIAHSDPYRATQLLEQNKGALGDEYEPLQQTIETRGSAVASSNISDSVLQSHVQSDGSYDVPYDQMVKEVRDKAREQFPNNPVLADSSVTAFRSKIFASRFATEQDKRENLHQIDTAILNNPDVHDTQGLMALPGMSKAIEQYGKYDPHGAAELNSRIFNVRQAANRVTRDDSLRYIYHGMANGDGNQSIEDFLKVDPFDPKWHLDVNDAKAIIQKQFEIGKTMRVDPKVNSSFTALVNSMGGQLDALNVIGKNADKQQLYAFKGALGAALEEWQLENKRPPTNEELVQKIGPALVRQVGDAGSTVFGIHIPFTGDQEPTYTRLQKHVEEVTQAAKDKNITVPSEDEIRRAYLQQTFQQLFGGSSGTSAKPKSTGPGSSQPAPFAD